MNLMITDDQTVYFLRYEYIWIKRVTKLNLLEMNINEHKKLKNFQKRLEWTNFQNSLDWSVLLFDSVILFFVSHLVVYTFWFSESPFHFTWKIEIFPVNENRVFLNSVSILLHEV